MGEFLGLLEAVFQSAGFYAFLLILVILLFSFEIIVSGRASRREVATWKEIAGVRLEQNTELMKTNTSLARTVGIVDDFFIKVPVRDADQAGG